MDNPPILPEVIKSIKPWLKFLDVNINEPAINKCVRQIRYLATTLSGDNKIAWLLKLISFIDLTALGGDDTSTNMESLCNKATTIVEQLTTLAWNKPLYPAGICVYPSRIKDVVASLKKAKNSSLIKIVSVAGGFPSGQYPLETRLQEVRCAIEYGAQEIDVVIDRSLVLNHEWIELYNELVAIRNVCNEKEKVCLKVILSTGELCSLKNIYKTSMIAMFAGANFIKTSTGKEEVNATLPVGIVMCRAIKDYERFTSTKVGFKPAGGIQTVQDALEWMVLIKEELGQDWLTNSRFRIGASKLLDNIIKEINQSCNINVIPNSTGDSKNESNVLKTEKKTKSKKEKSEQK